jgi:hypothetical protein
VNLNGLKAGFERNKKGLAVAGAVAVGGLALMQARKGGTAGPQAGQPGATAVPARIPAPASQQTASASGWAPYDSTASDVYNALQPMLERVSNQLDTQRSPIPLPPMASNLDAPTFTGTYVTYGDGSVHEVQSDGSLFHLSLPQYGDVQRRFGTDKVAPLTIAGAAPTAYSTTSNLMARIKAATGAA